MRALDDWIVAQGLEAQTLPEFVDGLATRLNSAGFALLRVHVARAALDPVFSGTGSSWLRDRGTVPEHYTHASDREERWQQSPMKAMLDQGLLNLRRRLAGPGAQIDFPVLEEFRDLGGTDWVAKAVRFTPDNNPTVLIGTIFTFLTDRPGGFTAAEEAALEWLAPRIGVVVFRLTLALSALTLIDAYIGEDPGRRILRGQIKLGDVVHLPAVLLVADLRGFTRLSETTPPDRLIAALNDYLGIAVEAIAAQGGEVLKFLGDGLLAVFDLEARPESEVCDAALSAAEAILAEVETLNAGRADTAMAMDIALHLGEVLYGNVGSARRLDFTTIGPAVNRASRIEALCEPLGQHLLMSESFAKACGRPLRDMGEHQLRGVASPQRLYTRHD